MYYFEWSGEGRLSTPSFDEYWFRGIVVCPVFPGSMAFEEVGVPVGCPYVVEHVVSEDAE